MYVYLSNCSPFSPLPHTSYCCDHSVNVYVYLSNCSLLSHTCVGAAQLCGTSSEVVLPAALSTLDSPAAVSNTRQHCTLQPSRETTPPDFVTRTGRTIMSWLLPLLLVLVPYAAPELSTSVNTVSVTAGRLKVIHNWLRLASETRTNAFSHSFLDRL